MSLRTSGRHGTNSLSVASTAFQSSAHTRGGRPRACKMGTVSFHTLVARPVRNLFFSQHESESVDSIEISGSAEFLLRTKEALDLLKPTPFFGEIQRYIAVINEGRRSGMRADAEQPTFVVGRPTWKHSALWYAGAIAHDSYHSKLYHEARASMGKTPPADCWTGSEAESKCLAFQLEAVETLGAAQDMVAYVRELEKNPTYQGHHRGWRGWRDYLTRWW